MSLATAIIIPERDAFAIDAYHSDGLSLRVNGGPILIAGQTTFLRVLNAIVALAASATNFVEVSPAGVISANTTGFTSTSSPLFRVTTNATAITGLQDWRGNPSGVATPVTMLASRAKVGTTAGWVVAAADNLGKMATIPQSQTSSTLVVPILGLKVGDTINAFSLIGSIQSAGNAGSITADLRKLLAAAAGATDSSVGAMAAPLSVVANTIISAANAVKAGLTEVVVAGATYYLLITSTTGASVTEELQGALITVTPA